MQINSLYHSKNYDKQILISWDFFFWRGIEFLFPSGHGFSSSKVSVYNANHASLNFLIQDHTYDDVCNLVICICCDSPNCSTFINYYIGVRSKLKARQTFPKKVKGKTIFAYPQNPTRVGLEEGGLSPG